MYRTKWVKFTRANIVVLRSHETKTVFKHMWQGRRRDIAYVNGYVLAEIQTIPHSDYISPSWWRNIVYTSMMQATMTRIDDARLRSLSSLIDNARNIEWTPRMEFIERGVIPSQYLNEIPTDSELMLVSDIFRTIVSEVNEQLDGTTLSIQSAREAMIVCSANDTGDEYYILWENSYD